MHLVKREKHLETENLARFASATSTKDVSNLEQVLRETTPLLHKGFEF